MIQKIYKGNIVYRAFQGAMKMSYDKVMSRPSQKLQAILIGNKIEKRTKQMYLDVLLKSKVKQAAIKI